MLDNLQRRCHNRHRRQLGGCRCNSSPIIACNSSCRLLNSPTARPTVGPTADRCSTTNGDRRTAARRGCHKWADRSSTSPSCRLFSAIGCSPRETRTGGWVRIGRTVRRGHSSFDVGFLNRRIGERSNVHEHNIIMLEMFSYGRTKPRCNFPLKTDYLLNAWACTKKKLRAKCVVSNPPLLWAKTQEFLKCRRCFAVCLPFMAVSGICMC